MIWFLIICSITSGAGQNAAHCSVSGPYPSSAACRFLAGKTAEMGYVRLPNMKCVSLLEKNR